MKILILSDSHSALSFMRRCISVVKPNAVVHLGDHYDDGCAMAEEFPHICFYQVPGNCDRYRSGIFAAETLVDWVCGVKLFMTHGHIHRVKSGFYSLIRDAEAANVQAVLFGHTHEAYCEQMESGMWVVNPGSCGYYGGTAALMEVSDKKISDCRIIGQSDLEQITLETETQVR